MNITCEEIVKLLRVDIDFNLKEAQQLKVIKRIGTNSYVRQAMFCLRVCEVVFPRVLRFSPHLPIDSSRYE